MNSAFYCLFILALMGGVGLSNAFPLHPKFYHADAEKFVPGEYIVVLNEDSTLEHLVDLAERYEARIRYEIGDTFKGFAAKLSDETLALLLEEPNVSFIEPDQIMSTNVCPDRQVGVCWGQDRVTASGPNDLDDKLHYKTNDGAGVSVYVIDTGILITHNDFAPGRAIWGYNAVAGSSNTDKNGHGTHVASTAVGNSWGFAKKSTVYAVKVLGDDGSGSNSGVIDGVNWVANQKKTTGKPTVGNMSLGGGLSTALNNAVNAAVNIGVIMAVAAGNDNKDACSYSPASATAAITVGATQQAVTGSTQIDSRSSFSNWGSCLDIFAPGSLITAAWIGSNSALKTISGTSMASPHVAGIAAVLLGENKSLSPSSMKQLLNNDAQVNLITMGCAGTCGTSPNRLLHRKSC